MRKGSVTGRGGRKSEERGGQASQRKENASARKTSSKRFQAHGPSSSSSSSSAITTDHEVIREWIEERGGRPASVKGTGKGDDAGLLRVDFPGYGDDQALEEVDWEDFFQKFDEKGLAFLYQERTGTGQTSRFFKFISRETAEQKR